MVIGGGGSAELDSSVLPARGQCPPFDFLCGSVGKRGVWNRQSWVQVLSGRSLTVRPRELLQGRWSELSSVDAHPLQSPVALSSSSSRSGHSARPLHFPQRDLGNICMEFVSHGDDN